MKRPVMIGKILVFIFAGILMMNISGCAAVLIGAAGTAGGAGTALWLSEKLTQEVDAPFERAVKAAKSALKSLRLAVVKETIEQNSAQIIGRYTDGKTIWIDVHRLTDSSSKIEVRVGAVSSNKEAAAKILKRINRYL